MVGTDGRLGRRWRRLLLVVACAMVSVVGAAVGAVALADFGDVAAGHAHGDGIDWVADVGVTAGCGDGSDYCPNSAVTRDQMATFLHRLSGNAPGVAPSVDAATVGGLTPDQLQGAQGPEGPQGPEGSVDQDVLDAITDRLDALEADNAALETRVDDLESANTTLEGQVDDLAADNAELVALLDGVERTEVGGRDTLRLEAMNLQVVDGTGSTAVDDGDTPNGLGNLIIGYNELRPDPYDTNNRTGVHYLVVGEQGNYSSYGGIIAGYWNTASGPYATVTGGEANHASGTNASISGGINGVASGSYSSVSGGLTSEAAGWASSVSGGFSNTATGESSSVSGGRSNTASGDLSSVSGGSSNEASGERSSVSGGSANVASGYRTSISGGLRNTASGGYSSILGGQDVEVVTTYGTSP